MSPEPKRADAPGRTRGTEQITGEEIEHQSTPGAPNVNELMPAASSDVVAAMAVHWIGDDDRGAA